MWLMKIDENPFDDNVKFGNKLQNMMLTCCTVDMRSQDGLLLEDLMKIE